MRFDDFSHAIANNNTQSIVITITTGGSLVMEVSKVANYNVDVYAS
jgi:soluble P-type ATPase